MRRESERLRLMEKTTNDTPCEHQPRIHRTPCAPCQWATRPLGFIWKGAQMFGTTLTAFRFSGVEGWPSGFDFIQDPQRLSQPGPSVPLQNSTSPHEVERIEVKQPPPGPGEMQAIQEGAQPCESCTSHAMTNLCLLPSGICFYFPIFAFAQKSFNLRLKMQDCRTLDLNTLDSRFNM